MREVTLASWGMSGDSLGEARVTLGPSGICVPVLPLEDLKGQSFNFFITYLGSLLAGGAHALADVLADGLDGGEVGGEQGEASFGGGFLVAGPSDVGEGEEVGEGGVEAIEGGGAERGGGGGGLVVVIGGFGDVEEPTKPSVQGLDLGQDVVHAEGLGGGDDLGGRALKALLDGQPLEGAGELEEAEAVAEAGCLNQRGGGAFGVGWAAVDVGFGGAHEGGDALINVVIERFGGRGDLGGDEG
jgi:hypothetical protein